jgi:hypothetical protein
VPHFSITSYESICFGNLEFTIANDGELMPFAGTLTNGIPTQDTPNRRLLSYHEQANCLQTKQVAITAQLATQRVWLHQKDVQPMWHRRQPR